jgi:cytochrome c553
MDGLRWRTGLLWLAIFAVILIVGAALFVASGVYNVAASANHFRATEVLIEFALRRSVALHSIGVTAPDLEDKGLIRLGANHFRVGCAPCHGSPLGSNDPIVAHMYPEPPPLGEAVQSWDSEELFWIVRHGLKFTGMPAWSGKGRDEEVWAVVAFLKRLPGMSDEEFRNLVGAADGLLAFSETPRLELCTSCHGDASAPPVSDLVPALRGQTAAYLRRSLEEYQHNLRQSGIMEPIAAALDEGMIDEMASHYSHMQPIGSVKRKELDPQSVRRGRLIAANGIPAALVPPCLACHSGRASPMFPVLAGLSAEYIEMQLNVFRKGLRDRTAYGVIMTTVAKRLSPAATADVAAYFSSLTTGDVAASPEAQESGQR